MKTLSASAARQTLPNLLGSVLHEREPILIERRGKPVAALVSVEDLKTIEKEGSADWDELLQALPDLNVRLDNMTAMLKRERQSAKVFRKEMDRLHAQRKKLLCRS